MTQQVRGKRATEPVSQLKADIYETPGGEAYVIEIPVPGVKPDEIGIEVTVDSITVSTQRKDPDSGRKYVPRPARSVLRYRRRERRLDRAHWLVPEQRGHDELSAATRARSLSGCG